MTYRNEEEIRRLRDNIYGLGTDPNWEACKQHWCTDDRTDSNFRWLKEHQPKTPAPLALG